MLLWMMSSPSYVIGGNDAAAFPLVAIRNRALIVLQVVPFVAMTAIILATILRGVAIKRRTGDRPLAFLSAKGVQRIAGLVFALSSLAMLVASARSAMHGSKDFTEIAALISTLGAVIVIIAQIQMGRAWRIGVREGDAPLFISHGLFRFSRNPIFIGMMLTGLGINLAAANWWAWMALGLFCIACAVQVRIEESHLEASFGQDYRDFCVMVPRWIGCGPMTA